MFSGFSMKPFNGKAAMSRAWAPCVATTTETNVLIKTKHCDPPGSLPPSSVETWL